MRKITFLVFLFITSLSFGQILIDEDFDYPNGSLVGNGTWASHSGAGTNAIQVSSGEISMLHGSGVREDVNIPFTSTSTVKYAGFDITVTNGAAISGTDNEYFAHFNSTGFRARIDVVPPTGAGDFRIGIASNSSTAEATWATDLTFGVTYRIVVRYDETSGQSQLWIDPSLESDTSILGSATSPTAVTSFCFRQSNSSSDETITVDNLIVSENFMSSSTLSTPQNNIGKDFSLYPNPLNGATSLTIQGLTNRNTSVVIYDMLGKEVVNTTVTNNTLNVSSLNAGIYLVKILEDNSSKSTIKKLIVR
ncbi:T9SS type A sorting domain-containing protein [Kordia jejudonensis]|uniref:T9SS type A sorting domain-containing protein n=1 Tax=Kordia jejudonensis TaxID=1348245 RepID=UPI00069BADC1|nr:T9SS type A sorting domain-containing protein [Kordia jejudonensis]